MDTQSWYVIRVTRNRTDAVYKDICSTKFGNLKKWKELDFYYPRYGKSTFTVCKEKIKQTMTETTPIIPGIIFTHATEQKFRELLAEEIPGLTPYYDHFHTTENGKNPFLIVPDKQFEDFRKVCETDDSHKIINQKDMPEYLNGKKVRIISGSFKGVEGIMLRWHSMRRVFIDLGPLGKFGTGFIRSCDFQIIEEEKEK